MTRRVSNKMKGLLSESTSAASGVTEHGAALDLKYVTGPAIIAARTAMVNAHTDLTAARDLLRQRYAVLATLSKDVRRLAALSRETLKPELGHSYSTAWNSFGFFSSLTVPKAAAKLEAMAETMGIFFNDHPTLELPPRVTALKAAGLYTAISNARTAVESQKTVVKNLLLARNEKVTVLYNMLLTVVGELDIALDPMDARWLSFGLPIPGIPKTPAVPTGFTAVLVGTNGASLKWNRATRAKYYRVWKKVIGTDDDFIPVGSPADLDFILESLPANSNVEIAVSAVNAGGESGRSLVAVLATV